MDSIHRAKKTDRFVKMREEMNNKFEAILKEIKFSKSASTVTNPTSKTNETQITQQSGSKNNKSIGVNASNTKNSDTENEEYRLKDSEMKDLKHPATPLQRIELDLDATMVSNEDSHCDFLF